MRQALGLGADLPTLARALAEHPGGPDPAA
jgi:hypothetical protein